MIDEHQAVATIEETEAAIALMEAVEAPVPAPPTKTKAERLLEEELWYSKRIAEGLAFEEKCRDEWERAKDRAKECKELLDGASASLRSIIKDRASLKDRPILTACEPIEEGPPDDDDDDDDQVEGPEDDWRSVPLAEALSILDARRARAILDAATFAASMDLPPLSTGEAWSHDAITMGVVHALFAEGRTILALDLDDETQVDFLSALNGWARGYDWQPGQEYPEAFPSDFLAIKFHGLEKVVKRVRARAKKAARSGVEEASDE